MTQLRGVNLGGWLVLERWITPSLFVGTDAIDEYTFMQTPDAKAKLRKHRDTFITEADFQWLRDHGLNAIRLPVGYWILTPDTPFESGIRYVDWAFRMAEKYGLQVLLDLHGAPGSQNGHDHSGRAGHVKWFNDANARQQTLSILEQLHMRYASSPSYWGIELLNEPRAGWHNPTLRHFYKTAIRQLGSNKKVIFHDGFRPRTLSGTLSGHGEAVMDVHLYHMASWWARYISAELFVTHVQKHWGRLLRRLEKQQPIIVGEWSCVLKGEAIAHLDTASAVKLQLTFGQKQLETFEQFSTGWFYWNYTTEDPESLWNFKRLIDSEQLKTLQ